jgi:hypothetical protein
MKIQRRDLKNLRLEMRIALPKPSKTHVLGSGMICDENVMLSRVLKIGRPGFSRATNFSWTVFPPKNEMSA